MSYRDRVLDVIQLTAPDKTVFTAKWAGNKIKAVKRVGEFNYPGIDGTVVQDQGLKGFLWPLTLYFDEDPVLWVDHDLRAMAFMNALALKGTDGRAIWTVIHPVYGTHYLQPLDAELDSNPVQSDGLSVVETNWIEPIAQTPTLSAGQPIASATPADASYYAGATDAQIQAQLVSGAAQAQGNIITQTQDAIFAATSYCNKYLNIAQGYINMANQAVATVSSALQAVLTTGFNVLSMVGAVQQLMLQPGIIATTTSNQIKQLSAMGGAIFAQNPSTTAVTASNAPALKNAASVTELWGASILGAMCQAAITNTFTTRNDALQAITDINAYFTAMTTALDASQTAFAGTALTGQYFSQSKSFADCVNMVALTVAYLIATLFSLSVVKTYVLTTGRTTMEIAMSEYKRLGAWQDSYFDLFCSSNRLYGNDLLWLPAGRKVSVYL